MRLIIIFICWGSLLYANNTKSMVKNIDTKKFLRLKALNETSKTAFCPTDKNSKLLCTKIKNLKDIKQ